MAESDYDEFFDDETQQARSLAALSVDADPDAAARSQQLSDVTGAPASVISLDPENFEKQHKTALNDQLIKENSYLQSYILAHPMAAKVSSDDWAQMDTVSEKLHGLRDTGSALLSWLRDEHNLYEGKDWRALGSSAAQAVRGMMTPPEAFREGFGEQPIGSSVLSRPQDIEWAMSHPAMASVAAAVATPPEVLSRTIGGLVRFGHDKAASVFGDTFANDMAGMAEWAMMRGDIATPTGAGLPLHNAEMANRISDVARAKALADPWAKAGLEPPAGLHPILDEAKKIQAKEDANALDDALAEAAKSATRERSPALFAAFVRSHLGDREIGISAEAVRELYGDKVPARDDNLLGWIPDLDQRLAGAELTGGDVRVPLADWLANVEPDVAKQLHDDIRVRNGGLTINETKVKAEPVEVGADHLQQVRGAAGLEPLAMAGDRNVQLRKVPQKQMVAGYGDRAAAADEAGEQWSRMTPEEQEELTQQHFNRRTQAYAGLHDIDILDENGKQIGTINISEQKGGKQLYIDMIQAGEQMTGFYSPNFLGPSLVRSIKAQLKAMFPNAETVTGHRVSGARGKAQTYMESHASPEVKLQLGEDPQSFRDLLQPYWEAISPSVDVLRKPEPGWTPMEQAIRQAVESERQRMTPSAEAETVHAIYYPRVGGTAHGLFQPTTAKMFVSLEKGIGGIRPGELGQGLQQVGTLRHEAIHYLYREGFFTDKEWSTLAQAAKDEGWREKFKIDKLYKNFSEEIRNEEAIAEAYRSWRLGEGIVKDSGVFQKIKDFMDSVRRRIVQYLGRDLSWEDIFKEIDEGRVGRRELEEPERGDEPLAMGPSDFKTDENPPKPANDRTAREAAWKRMDYLVQEMDKINEKKNATEFDWLRFNKIKEEYDQLGKTSGPRPKFDRDTHEPLAQAGDEEGEGFGLYDKAKALGVTQTHMDRMLRLIEKRNAEDFEASKRRAEVRQRRRSNKEWKDRRTALRDDVREELNQRPDVAMDQLFSKQKIKLDPATLSEEQKARLPKDYIQKKDGVNPDDLAPYFGYTSGDALIERLGMFTEDRRRSGLSPRDYLNRLIDVETDRRLNQEFGDREQTILDEAKDQALSETQLNLVHEETLAYALKAGQEPTFTKDQVRDMVKQSFDQQPVGSIKSWGFLQAAGRIGKKIEEAGAKGDWAAAYRLSQQRNHAVLYAKFARDYEKARAQFDRVAKQFRKREVASVAAEYTNWIHDVLQRVGYPINRSIQDLAENIGRQTEQTLADFVDAKEQQWSGVRELPVADFLKDPNFRKPVDELSHQDFLQLKSSLDVLVKAGRDERKVIVGGETFEREQLLGDMRAQLATFGYKPKKAELPKVAGVQYSKWPRAFVYGLESMETFMNRLSRGDPRGIFNRFFYPLADAANGKAKTQREIAKDFAALPKLKDLDKLVDSPLTDPLSRSEGNPDGSGTWSGFTRGHVIKMLLNAGNDSNWKVLAAGYGENPKALFNWLQNNVTKDDIAFAEGMGNIFKKLIARYDNVRERQTGMMVEKIKLAPIQFKLRDGTVVDSQGWYHPLVADPVRKTVWRQDDAGQWSQLSQGKRDLLKDEFFNFAVADGFTKKRTGAIYPLDLNFSAVPTTINQMIHAIHFKEVINETQKIFSDPRFAEDVSKYYGREFSKGLMPYLRAVAGAEGVPGEALQNGMQMSNLIRQNVISTYIGFNPFTVLKHGPTAWVMSAREAGAGPFAKAFIQTFPDAVKSIFFQAPSVMKTNRDFVLEHSEEVQRRERHWQDTIAGQGREIEGAGNLHGKIIEKGSAAVAWSDMVSAIPTWLAVYNKSLGDGLSHGESVTLADRAVRRAHGSTAETNQPPLVRGSGEVLHPWLTSVYGFFGTAMQRRIETAHKLIDAYDLGVNEREFGKASRKLSSAFGDFMTYMIWPTIVEEAVNGIGTDDHRTWGTRIISGSLMGAASSVLYLRDLIHAATTGRDPGVGMLSSFLADQNKVVRDLYHGREAFNKQHAAKTVGDLMTAAGEVTGMMPKAVSNVVRYGMSVAEGQEKPRSITDVLLGAARGTQKRRVEK